MQPSYIPDLSPTGQPRAKLVLTDPDGSRWTRREDGERCPVPASELLYEAEVQAIVAAKKRWRYTHF